MRNIDNAASLGFQFANDAEQGFGFSIGEGIRRFIHNDDLRFKAQHFGNFDHLLIANRQLTDQPVAFKAQIEFGEQQIGFGVHLLPVNFAKAIHKLTAKKNVLGDSELRDQVQLLVDDTDSGFLGGFRAVKGGLFPQPQ